MQTIKEERIEIRISAQDKQLMKEAQKLSGDTSFSSFIVRVVKKEAEEIIATNNDILISQRDRELFFDAVFGRNKPNLALKQAAKNYKAKKAKDVHSAIGKDAQ